MSFKNIFLSVMHTYATFATCSCFGPKAKFAIISQDASFQYNSDYLSVSSMQNHANNCERFYFIMWDKY